MALRAFTLDTVRRAPHSSVIAGWPVHSPHRHTSRVNRLHMQGLAEPVAAFAAEARSQRGARAQPSGASGSSLRPRKLPPLDTGYSGLSYSERATRKGQVVPAPGKAPEIDAVDDKGQP